jgi:phenylacetate-CoA ligase
MKLWEKTGSFVGSKSNTSLKSWYERLGVLRKMILYSSDSPSKWMSALSHWKPQIITGYVMTLKLLASEISSHKQKNINPRLIFHSSGILDETSRTFISNVLGGKVIDIYGSDEGGCIAWECPKCNGYHINSDLLILELLTNGNAISKNTGEVVITNLHSYAMPLIRYKQGDVASFSDSTNLCKRGFPLLKNIQGRIDDFITLPSGRKISPHPFYWALLDIPEVSEWKIVQQQKDLLNIEIVVKNNTSSNNICTRISDNLNKILCNEMKIDIYSVQNIARNPNQKFRSVMSNLKEDMYT